jgi:hypothetical protein
MQPDDLPPIDADLARLLRSERGAPPMPRVRSEQLLARLEESLRLPPPPDPFGPTSPPAAAGPGALARLGARVGQWIWRPAPAAAIALGLGIVVGARVVPAPPPERIEVERVRIVERIVPGPAAEIPVQPLPPPVAPVAPIATPVHAPTALSASAARPSRSPLAEERGGIEVARAALARGDGAAALEATRELARRFPDGVFAEEREALAIQALAVSGDSDGARRRAAAFRARYPDSLFRSAVRIAAGDAP